MQASRNSIWETLRHWSGKSDFSEDMSRQCLCKSQRNGILIHHLATLRHCLTVLEWSRSYALTSPLLLLRLCEDLMYLPYFFLYLYRKDVVEMYIPIIYRVVVKYWLRVLYPCCDVAQTCQPVFLSRQEVWEFSNICQSSDFILELYPLFYSS